MEELTGSWVLVHPDLAVDPANSQGAIGTITHADLSSDTFRVAFWSGEQGLYASDALLIPKSHGEFYKHLLSNVREIPNADYKKLLALSLLLDSGGTKNLKTALETARAMPEYLSFVTESLEDKLSREVKNTQSQDYDSTELSR